MNELTMANSNCVLKIEKRDGDYSLDVELIVSKADLNFDIAELNLYVKKMIITNLILENMNELREKINVITNDAKSKVSITYRRYQQGYNNTLWQLELENGSFQKVICNSYCDDWKFVEQTISVNKDMTYWLYTDSIIRTELKDDVLDLKITNYEKFGFERFEDAKKKIEMLVERVKQIFN